MFLAPTLLAPWQAQTSAEIKIEPDREQAKEIAAVKWNMPGTTVLSDAAGQQNYLGAAAVALKKDVHILISQQVSIASMEHWLVYVAELIVIFYTITLVLK